MGINLDGVLIHDGIRTPQAATRFAWVRHSGAFDYIEKNIDPGEDFAPYFDLVERHGVPIEVFGGIFCAGQDEARLRWGLATGGRLGSKLFNIQLYARHASGRPISDAQVVAFYQEALEHGAPVGCLPTLEVHVDMWSEDFQRVERIANRLAQSNTPLRLTLDHSHLIFKIGHADELALSGLSDAADGARAWLAPGHADTLYAMWLREGWVAHAHARSVAPGITHNAAMNRRRGLPGRAIQYPFVEPTAGSFHADWQEDALAPWKSAVTDLLGWRAQQPDRAPARISCEFIPFADYGGGGRYSIWANNLACAAWLREQANAVRETARHDA
ncbi:MAG: xylose isomerase [Leptothrix sp. (in: b-proteobacteria)]